MKNRTLFFALSAFALSLGTMPLGGCGYLKARSARSAYNQYQVALAAGDLRDARKALLKLVRIDQDVPEYWMALGKLQVEMGRYPEAYSAFQHAHELDRSNVDALSAMTQLAMVTGQNEVAEENARSLALIAPGNPIVTMVRAYADLRAGDLDKADAGIDGVLATTPNDPLATIVKARVLLAKNRFEDAVAVLEAQHRAVPSDRGAMRNLARMYSARSDWRNLARIEYDAHQLDPKDSRITESLIEALLRAGSVEAAAKISSPLLTEAANAKLVDDVLDLWADHQPRGATLPNAMELAQATKGDRRVSFANYFNRVGNPSAAAALLRAGQLPVTQPNARWNAVFAQALALQGRTDEAKRLFDLVLDREPDQVEALRGRAALESKMGSGRAAIIDAQRLITVEPNSGQDRLLLAQVYLAAGNRAEVKRTLWQAFQDLPDDEGVFFALRSVLASTGDVDGQSRVEAEFTDRRLAELTKELV